TPLSDYALLFLAESRLGAGDLVGARAAAQRAGDGKVAPSALLEAAMVVSRAGDDGAAAPLFRRFLDTYGDHADVPRARLALGEALMATGRMPEAARVFNDLWPLPPAAPGAESAATQLRVLAERGLAGPPPAARERVARAERLLAARMGELARTEA